MKEKKEGYFFQFARSLSKGIQIELVRAKLMGEYRYVSLVSSSLSFILRDFYFQSLLGLRKRHFTFKKRLLRLISNGFIFIFGVLVFNFLIYKIIAFLHGKRRRGISIGFLGWDSEIRYKKIADNTILYFENVDKIYHGLRGVKKNLFFMLQGNIFLLGLSKTMLNMYLRLTKLGYTSLIRYDMSVIAESLVDTFRYKRLLKKLANRRKLWRVVNAHLNPPRVLSFFLGYHSGRKLSKDYSPRVFVVTNEGNIAIRGFVLALRESRVKVFALQHGVIHKHHFAYYRLPLEHKLPVSGVADLTLLYGEYYKRVLTEMGYPDERLVIVGSPRYDDFFGDKAKLIKERIRNSYNLSGDLLVLSIFTQPQGEKVLSYLDRFKKAVRLLSERGSSYDLFVFLKPHPGERNNTRYIEEYKKFVKEIQNIGYKASFIEFGKHTSLELLLVTNMAFSITSTVLIEALLLGVIPISFEKSDIDHIRYMRENGCLLTVRDERELIEIISGYNKIHEQFHEMCRQFSFQFLANPGKSTKAIVDLIEGNL